MALLAAVGVMMVSVGLVSAEISCEPLAVRTGEPAFIICLFDVDVSVAKKNIKVQRRPLTSTRFDPDKAETVLDCYWQNAADFSCQFGSGFKLVGEAGRTAVVRIASASKIDEQVYMCEVVPSDPSNIQTCTLTMRDTHPLDGNFSIVNFAPEQLQDDTAQVKGIVTAIIIIICVIVGLVLVVLVIVFRKQFKENLQKWRPRAPTHDASIGKKDNADPEAAIMLTESNKRAGNESKSTEDLRKENERIERYVSHLLNMKDTGRLEAFYKVSRTDEKEKTGSASISGGATAPDRRHTYTESTTVPKEECAGRDTRTNKRQERSESSQLQESQYIIPNDPLGLHITLDEWYSREKEKLERIKKELDLRKELYSVRIKHRKEIADENKSYEKKKITDQNEKPDQRRKREAAQKKRLKEESDAAFKLESFNRKHEELLQLQEEHDRKRLEGMRSRLQMVNKRRTQSEEETRRKSPLLESAEGRD